jgi:predicted dehydrogenase
VFDMMFFLNGDVPAQWVLGQIDMRDAQEVFGSLQVGAGLAELRFANGVRAIYRCGKDHEENGCLLRLLGNRGVIELGFGEPWLRIRRSGQAEWEVIDTGENIHDFQAVWRGIADIFRCLENGGVPQLDSSRALRATEVIFAVHESARRRGRVDLPLPAGPCALLAMVASGELKVG